MIGSVHHVAMQGEHGRNHLATHHVVIDQQNGGKFVLFANAEHTFSLPLSSCLRLYSFAAETSCNQPGAFNNSRGREPSAGPTKPSRSMRSMRCAARPYPILSRLCSREVEALPNSKTKRTASSKRGSLSSGSPLEPSTLGLSSRGDSRKPSTYSAWP